MTRGRYGCLHSSCIRPQWRLQRKSCHPPRSAHRMMRNALNKVANWTYPLSLVQVDMARTAKNGIAYKYSTFGMISVSEKLGIIYFDVSIRIELSWMRTWYRRSTEERPMKFAWYRQFSLTTSNMTAEINLLESKYEESPRSFGRHRWRWCRRRRTIYATPLIASFIFIFERENYWHYY